VSEQRRWKARFFTIWTGQQLSVIGSRAARFALVWWLTTTTGSATVLATASLVAYLPQIFLGPFVGTLVDRWNRKTVMLVADSFIALVSLWLAYMFWSGAMQPWHLYIVMLAASFGDTFHWPAMAASTTLMVPEKHLTRIGGLNQSINGVLTIAAPPLGALLMSLLPLHGVMMVDVATAAFAVLPLLFVAIPQPKTEHIEEIKQTPFIENLKTGLRFVLSWRGMVMLIVLASIVKIVLQPAFSLIPLLVHDHFGGGAADLSLLEAVAGIGILLGGLILSAWGGFRRKICTSMMGVIGMGVGSIVMGMAPASVFWMALGGAFLLGVMISMVDGPMHALMQSTIPPQMQGRVFALLGSLFSLTAPIGLALAGPLSDMFGIRIWFLVAGGLCIVTAVWGLTVPALIHIEDQRGASVEPADGASSPAAGFQTVSQSAREASGSSD